jgi:hypothetical protein
MVCLVQSKMQIRLVYGRYLNQIMVIFFQTALLQSRLTAAVMDNLQCVYLLNCNSHIWQIIDESNGWLNNLKVY